MDYVETYNEAARLNKFKVSFYKVERCLSVRLSDCLKPKISVTAEMIRLYFSGNIDTGHALVLSSFFHKYLVAFRKVV